MRNFILIITLSYISLLYSQDSNLLVTPDGILAERYITINPELDFLSSFEDTLFQDYLEKHTVCKINFDFNFDGIQDIALTDLLFWGAHFGPWAIFLGIENNQFLFLDELWFHNDAVKFDSISIGKSKVIVFDKAGGGEADIVEYLLSFEGIKETKRDRIYFESGKNFNEYNFQSLEDSCMAPMDYLNNKNIIWKKVY